mmetsp:Transcript_11245/g.20777  ORF Transcript_11245/g.20777 Transcript_11245/m.20777 type:complete len:812 (-) Transcript_11245:21-2456(-)
MKRRQSLEMPVQDKPVNLWEDSNMLTFTPLGSGREVGRSCHVLEFKGKKIMLDCGIHPGRKGENMLPYFDRFDMSEIDLLLISHFHLDHAASMPNLTERTSFKGQVYMTSSTKAVLGLVLKDYARILANDPTETPIYSPEEMLRCLDRCQTIGFHQEIEIDGIKITPYHAGHVLGAAMFLIEIAGVKILYTGDYSREDDRHLRGAEIPSGRPDVLIVESTFGLMKHEPREVREKRFTQTVEKIVNRGGNCLIPMGALGAVQELLLILEDHWNRNPRLKSFHIYHTSRIANEALKIYRTFIHQMNEKMRANVLSDPWEFDNIDSLGENEEIIGPAVVLASPGYLQSGKSRRLFEMWCQDPRNGVILAGYSVEGTLAKELSKEDNIEPFMALNGTGLLQVKCEVETITFAAHSDYTGTESFVDQLQPRNVIFVHGEEEQMRKLKYELTRVAEREAWDIKFFNPANGHKVQLPFQEQSIVKAYGGGLLQRRKLTQGSRVAAYLVREGFRARLVATEDIRLYTSLKTAAVMQKLHVPFHIKFEQLVVCVSKLFHPEVTGPSSLSIQGKIELVLKNNVVCISWEASPSNDMIADALTAILMQAEGGIPAVRVGTCCSGHGHNVMPKAANPVDYVTDGDGGGDDNEHNHDHDHDHNQIHQKEISMEVDGGPAVSSEQKNEDAITSPPSEEKATEELSSASPAGAAPAAGGQENTTAIEEEEEPAADVATVLAASPSAELLHRLLLERFGSACVGVLPKSLQVRETAASGAEVCVDLIFNAAGHVTTIRSNNPLEGELLESSIRELIHTAIQTVHPIA